jgi:MoaA/NifB/PqqE/SkfB family radical SAM enzyme
MYLEGFKTNEEALFPNIVNICVYRGACPCACIHCPVGKTPLSKRTNSFGSESISMDLYMKIIDEISLYPNSAARIHSVGEPLLWNNLIPALKYAREKNVKTWIFTSFVTHDKKKLTELANYADVLEISVNSDNASDYEATKGICLFDLVKNNIKFVSNYIKSNKLSSRFLLSRVESQDPVKDANFLAYWRDKGVADDCFIRSYHDYNGILSKEAKGEHNIFPCHVHWARFNIDCNGDAAVCFNELFKGKRVDSSLVLGNVSDYSIQEIWQGERINNIRKAQLTGNYNLVNFTDKLPCFNCKFCQPLFSNNLTSEHQLVQLRKD